MNRSWYYPALLTCVACSRRTEPRQDPESIPPGTAADSTDLSPDESGPMQWTAYLDSAEITGSLTDGEQPRVVVRCEVGRLGVYVVMGGVKNVDSAGDEAAVPVAIDSAPRC